MVQENLGDQQSYYTVHPEGNMSICTKFHGKPSKSGDISLWTKVVDRLTNHQTIIAIPLALVKRICGPLQALEIMKMIKLSKCQS